MKRAHLELPYLARESELWTLDLPAKRKVDYMRCHNSAPAGSSASQRPY